MNEKGWKRRGVKERKKKKLKGNRENKADAVVSLVATDRTKAHSIKEPPLPA